MRKIRMSKRLTALGQAITEEYEKVPCVDDTLLYTDSDGNAQKVSIRVDAYRNNKRICVTLMVAQSKEPFCRLTRNVPACDFPDKTMAAIGISNCIDNICFIAENRLGEVTDSMVMSGYNPVSYTHLDVYKRQALHRLQKPLILMCRCFSWKTKQTH